MCRMKFMERCTQFLHVFIAQHGTYIEVPRHQRRSMQESRKAANDYEIDVRVAERPNQLA
jgi:hypothetical protein